MKMVTLFPPESVKRLHRLCKCGHAKVFHKHNRSGTDCSKCKCLVHPDLGFDVYEISACRLYPENCRGYCWQYRDKRKRSTRILDFIRRR